MSSPRALGARTYFTRRRVKALGIQVHTPGTPPTRARARKNAGIRTEGDPVAPPSSPVPVTVPDPSDDGYRTAGTTVASDEAAAMRDHRDDVLLLVPNEPGDGEPSNRATELDPTRVFLEIFQNYLDIAGSELGLDEHETTLFKRSKPTEKWSAPKRPFSADRFVSTVDKFGLISHAKYFPMWAYDDSIEKAAAIR